MTCDTKRLTISYIETQRLAVAPRYNVMRFKSAAAYIANLTSKVVTFKYLSAPCVMLNLVFCFASFATHAALPARMILSLCRWARYAAHRQTSFLLYFRRLQYSTREQGTCRFVMWLTSDERKDAALRTEFTSKWFTTLNWSAAFKAFTLSKTTFTQLAFSLMALFAFKTRQHRLSVT